MRQHKGDHPRLGATDVCPLVSISDITMEETAAYARKLGQRIGDELGIPVYLYENAATEEKRRNLANNREGEYEGLKEKLSDPAWNPDLGPAEFNESVARSGATAVGARDFLIAVNFNLNTTSTRRANAIAFDVREKGRPKREGNPITGSLALGSDHPTGPTHSDSTFLRTRNTDDAPTVWMFHHSSASVSCLSSDWAAKMDSSLTPFVRATVPQRGSYGFDVWPVPSLSIKGRQATQRLRRIAEEHMREWGRDGDPAVELRMGRVFNT